MMDASKNGWLKKKFVRYAKDKYKLGDVASIRSFNCSICYRIRYK